MTGEDQLLLDDFKAKLRLLMKRHSNLKEERRVMAEKLAEMEKTIAELKSENEKLVKKYNDLKIAKALSVSDDDNKMVKQRINKIVREIDKCIAQLNV
jgi:vacuolar-type H+-ATPase subunit D/Vma8